MENGEAQQNGVRCKVQVVPAAARRAGGGGARCKLASRAVWSGLSRREQARPESLATNSYLVLFFPKSEKSCGGVDGLVVGGPGGESTRSCM